MWPIDPKLIARFNAKWVEDKTSGCLVWTGAKLPKGYGFIKLPRERRQIYAHRLSWLIHEGQVPDRIQVCHSCDNPSCVNPDHLFLGTSSDNHQDMKAKNRHLYGERNNQHKLTKSDIKVIRAMWEAGARQRLIAKTFGVAQVTISKIVRRTLWAHVK